MYVRLDTPTDLQNDRPTDIPMGSNYGEWEICSLTQNRVDDICRHSREGYYPANQQTIMKDGLRENLTNLLDMIEHPLKDNRKQDEQITDYVYKMGVF